MNLSSIHSTDTIMDINLQFFLPFCIVFAAKSSTGKVSYSNDMLKGHIVRIHVRRTNKVFGNGEGGIPADPDYADARHNSIKAVSSEYLGAAPPCLYGGSVTAENCADLIMQNAIDGLFAGRAAWAVGGYLDILRRAAAVLEKGQAI